MKPPEIDDIGDAIRERRALRPADAYRIQFALENLDFSPLTVVDPIPLGRQVLEAAGLEPDRGYSLFAIVETGDFEDVRLNEPFDLRGAGAERFVAFLTDRDFKFEVNSHEERWGKPAISGRVLAALAKPGPDEAVFLEVRGGTDVLVEPTMLKTNKLDPTRIETPSQRRSARPRGSLHVARHWTMPRTIATSISSKIGSREPQF